MRRTHDRRPAAVERESTPDAEPASAPPDRFTMSRIGREELLTVSAAAECVGCCEETIRRAYLARQLDVLRYGSRRVRIRRSALFAWLERGGKTTAA
jgi:excisionase family DNA binding protein